ncbi:hypothetical protein B0H14DRAFT_1455945 [Mycena olivaceomarginata]|nr:hypothetical protein B0H14DRAFT_1455945 [Mycena olivaceomarginata]
MVLSYFSLSGCKGARPVRRPASRALPNALARGPFAYPCPYPSSRRHERGPQPARLGTEQQDVQIPWPKRSPRGRRGGRYTAGSAAVLSRWDGVCVCVRCSVARFEGEVHWPGPGAQGRRRWSAPPDEDPLLTRGLDALGVGRGTVHSRCCSIASSYLYVCARASMEDPEGETKFDALRMRHRPSFVHTYMCTARIRRTRGDEHAPFSCCPGCLHSPLAI